MTTAMSIMQRLLIVSHSCLQTRLWQTLPSPSRNAFLAAKEQAQAQKSIAPSQDSALFDRLRRGDGDAWDALFAQWSPRLYSYLRYNLPTAQDAEDALGDTMVAAVRSIATFDSRVAVSTWLYALAHRKVADYWRRSRPTGVLSDMMPAAPRGSDPGVFEALAELPEAAREALLLRYHDGFGVDEIAQIIGRTYKATESLLSRGRRQLREVLNKRGFVHEQSA